ncbi:MAG: hypothetical protein GXY44_11815 [Phycisphaerales bacterium]|nr:hypothetical protein [Phycisphaerales bacterium]
MSLSIQDNTSVYRLLNTMQQLEVQRSMTLARLSTGLRINRASDNPAGLIAVKMLESELSSVHAALDNNQRTQSMLSVASGALAEVSSLLADIQQLSLASIGDTLSVSEKAANQAQVDSAIASIDRILGGTTFNGRNIFGGANQIAATLSMADAADLKDVRIYSCNPGQANTVLTVNVTAAATKATTAGTSIANVTSALTADTVLTVAGKDGTATITIASGSTLDQMISMLNQSTGVTGVSASKSGTELVMTSIDYGSEAFVSVAALSGDASLVGTAQTGKLTGDDATVTVNGQNARTSGTEIYYNGNGISFTANLADNTTGTRTITVVGGGATFQLGTDASTRSTIGLNGMNSFSLGRADLGYLSSLKSGGAASLTTDPQQAVTIVRKAITQVATESARLGGFIKYEVGSSINNLGVQQENLSSAVGMIRDADMAQEIVKLERINLLTQTTMALLSLVNNDKKTLVSLLR